MAVGNYSVSRKTVEGHTTYHLLDGRRKMDLGVVPDIGNFAYEFKVNGRDVLIPPASFKAYLESTGLVRVSHSSPPSPIASTTTITISKIGNTC